MCLNQIKFEVCMLCKFDHKFPKLMALTFFFFFNIFIVYLQISLIFQI